MDFPPLENSDHVVVSVSIDFSSYSQRDAPFHRIAYDYSQADWDNLHDHLRDVPWEDIFKLNASDKAKLFAENFSKNSNLDDSGISLPSFPSRTNLNLHNISANPKMVKKVIMNLDLSKASGHDCIPVAVLTNCEPELSYILAELFNKCLESCFPECWKVSLVVPVFRNVMDRFTAKNYHPVSLLSVVSKVFEKLVNNRIVDHLKKCGFFYFQHGFRSS